MKHNLLLFLLMFFFPFYSWGQASSEPVWTLLTDESELVDGGLYVMAGRVGHQFYGSHYQRMGAFFFYSSFLEGKNQEHASFREVLPYCDLLRFEKQEGEWCIRNLTAEHTDESRRFLCYDSDFPLLLKANYLINKGNRVTFAKENGVLNVSIGGKVLGYDRKNMHYVLDENAAKHARVEFYHIENSRLLLSDTLQLYCIDATAYVRLKRHFKSDCFNTLMLPFDVPDYKKVFGQGAVAYIPSEFADGKLHFTKVEASLKAHTPYLLCGKLDDVEDDIHDFGLCKIYFKKDVSLEHTMSGVTFHGVYHSDKRSFPKGDYLFGDKKLFQPKGKEKIRLDAFRWYLSCKAPLKAGTLRLSNIPLSLPSVSLSGQRTERIYTLEGRYVGSSLKKLPKGIYIRGGKKVAVK
jgi:hypothetical protein|nr:hypothetical protein [Segatella oris]